MPYKHFSSFLLNNYDGNRIVRKAFRSHQTDFHISVIGKIIDVLPDDMIGIPHQRFLIQIPNTTQTILVVHNLDYGPRLHAAVGDYMKVTGEYVWNQHGGLMHLTHYDPNRRFEPGKAIVVEEIHENPKPTVSPPNRR